MRQENEKNAISRNKLLELLCWITVSPLLILGGGTALRDENTLEKTSGGRPVVPCPICGKKPRVLWDPDYEDAGLGALCTIECKHFLRIRHLRVVSEGETWQEALENGIREWNGLAD